MDRSGTFLVASYVFDYDPVAGLLGVYGINPPGRVRIVAAVLVVLVGNYGLSTAYDRVI